MSWKSQAILKTSNKWLNNRLRFLTKDAALRYIKDAAGTWNGIGQWRVVESNDRATHIYTAEGALKPITGPRRNNMTRKRQHGTGRRRKRLIDAKAESQGPN